MKKLTYLSSLIATIFLFSSPAYAVCDGCVVNAVQTASTSIVTAINTGVSALSNLLNELDTHLSSVGSKISESIVQTGNMQRELAIEARQQSEQARINRETALPIDTCALSGSNYARQAQQSAHIRASSYRPGNTSALAPIKNSVLNKALSAPAPSIEASRRMSAAIHQTTYCNATEVKLDYPGCSPSALPDGDANVESLFTGAGLPGKEADLTFTPEQEEAARAYARLSLDAQPPENMTRAEANTEAGKLYLAMQKAYQANLSSSEKAFFDEIASHMPFPGSAKLISELKNAEAAAQYFDATASRIAKQTGTMSLAELEAFEVGRRWRNPHWVVEMSVQANPIQLAREQLFIHAFLADMQYQQLQKTKHIEVLLGQLLAATLRANDRMQLEIQLSRVRATNAR